jgi:hypothetical protein
MFPGAAAAPAAPFVAERYLKLAQDVTDALERRLRCNLLGGRIDPGGAPAGQLYS